MRERAEANQLDFAALLAFHLLYPSLDRTQYKFVQDFVVKSCYSIK